jgi:PAS domain S-box-containing protein
MRHLFLQTLSHSLSMTTRLRGYGLAVLCVVIAAICREAVSPFIGFGIIYGILPLCIWVSGRFGGLGPSVLALLLGAILVVVLRYTVHRFYWSNLEFQASLILYLVVGAIICLLSHSERNARASLLGQLAERKAMMDNTTAVIYLKDVQGRYLMINRQYERLFEVTQQRIAGKTDSDLFPSDIAAQIQANDQKVKDTGQPLKFEEVVPQADGHHTFVSVKFPVFDSAGRVTAVGGISTDISDRKKAADALEEERDLLKHTIEVQDQQRKLIAYEIHDGLVQYAAGALMQLESIQSQVKSEALGEQIERVVDILRKTLDEGRRIINGMHTTVLDDCGVVAAVDQLLEDEERAHVKVEFVKDSGLGRMAPSVELALYHITREALTNCYKHSQSDKVRIELTRSGDRVHLEIRDWGTGMVQPAKIKGIHGLRGMTERARIAGGECTVENARGKGTIIVVNLPYLSRN